MFGRILSLVVAGALAALAVLIYDPMIYGPEAPGVGLGAFEALRPAVLGATALLALAFFLGTVQPKPRVRKEPSAPLSLREEAAPVHDAVDAGPEEHSPFEPQMEGFSFGGGSNRPSPLW